eukprot:m.121411 g.121411  ORF g.121411 m.121411 type:complete len:543 (-) comp16203_c1_seq1:553-2181(-)
MHARRRLLARSRGELGWLGVEGLVLEAEVVLGGQADACAEEVLHGGALLEERVDNGGALRDERGLEHVGEDGADGVEGVKVGHVVGLPCDALDDLQDDDEVEDERGGQEGVLAGVVHGDGVHAVHEDLGAVLVEGALAVADGRYVLDDDDVVRVLLRLVEDVVGGHHVVDDVGLADLLGAELRGRREVLAVVVAEVVVRGDGARLDAGVDEKVHQHRLHLRLAALEVVASNVDALALGQLNEAGHARVLRGAIDEGRALEDASDGIDGRGRDLLVRGLDGGEQVVGRVVDARHNVGKALRVGRPQHNDLVHLLGLLEVADVLADGLEVGLLVRALEDVVGAVRLVGGDKVRVVDARQRHQVLHVRRQLAQQVVLEDLGAGHAVGEVHLADVPAANLNVVGVDHRHDLVEGDVDVIALRVDADAHGGGLRDAAKVVGRLLAVAVVPLHAELVGDDAAGDGGAVVAAPADKHDTELGHLGLRAQGVADLGRLDLQAVALDGHGGVLVGELGRDGVVGILHVVRLDADNARVEVADLSHLVDDER